MGRHCFVLGCKANTWRKRQTRTRSPAFFGFPKSKSLFEEWRDSLPRRTAFEREPTEHDHICSLHFKYEDVVKYYEYNCFKGLPKNEVVRLERGTWTLKRNAVPCYFDNDNPDEKQLIRNIKTRVTKNPPTGNIPCSPVKNNDHEESIGELEVYDSRAEAVSVTMDVSTPANDCDREDHASHLDDESVSSPQENSLESESAVYENDDACSDHTRIALLDHCYHLPVSNSKEKSDPKTTKTKLKYDPYTIEQLHEDVLDVVLPKKWAFFQNDEENVTAFLLYNDDMTVNRSVRFPGSCCPYVTVNNSVMQHRRINSKEEIQELILCVSVM